MLIDTHCHLNFKAFDGRLEEIICNAKKAGIERIVVPGTDFNTSLKAIEIAERFDGVYAAVGIHPHHVKKYQISNIKYQKDLKKIERLLNHPKVVAVGEIGLDRHVYEKTKYENYQINEEFIELQKYFFIEQIKLAKKYKKSVIIHNRQAKKDILKILTDLIDSADLTDYRLVFHCCEPDEDLLDFAIKNKIFIGVDGDVVYWREKQEFIKKVHLDLLVLETDAPFLSPFKKFPNEPKNIAFIAEFIAKLLNCSTEKIKKTTTKNAEKLFNFG